MDVSLREVFDRYGPTLALIVTVVLLVTLLPSNTTDDPVSASDAGSSGDSVASGGSDPGGSQASGATAPSDAGSTAQGDVGAAPSVAGLPAQDDGATTASAVGELPCRPDGRQSSVSVLSPPCRQYDRAAGNGGATSRGVTDDEIKWAYYVPRPDAAGEAALKAAGVGDEQVDVNRYMEVWRRYMNAHTQTYGREITLRRYEASGPAGDDVSGRADAKRIAEDGMFGVVTARGTTGNLAFDRTAARLGLPCMGCSITQAKSFYDETKGLSFHALPTLREYYESLGEYIAKRLIGRGRTAQWAGPPTSPAEADIRKAPRKFGLIWVNAVNGVVDPGAQEERDYFVEEILPRYGVTDVVDSSYDYDITKGPATAQTVLARMNTGGVTSIMCMCDPLMPVFFTREATKQAYFPEWLQTGTGLTDTTFFGRTYDQQQWAHSFGISLGWVFWEHLAVSDGYREYHHMCPFTGLRASECADGKETVGTNDYRVALLFIAMGVSGAGPNLTPQSFATGLYEYPYTGGVPHIPLIGFTPDLPNAIKDWSEVFWDANRSGPDEVDNQGQGILLKVAGGTRYRLGQFPTTDPVVFTNGGGEVFVSDKPYTDPAYRVEHEEDGHTHDPDQRCLSC